MNIKVLIFPVLLLSFASCETIDCSAPENTDRKECVTQTLELDTPEVEDQETETDNSESTLPEDETPNKDKGNDQVGVDPIIEPPQTGGSPLTYQVHELVNFTPEQRTKFMEALKKLQIVLNSEVFKDMVLNHRFKGEKSFNYNLNYSNEEIFDILINSDEKQLKKGPDHIMDLSFTMYYKNNSVVGYTYPDTTMIWINSKFFNKYDLASVAKNIAHEWTHKLGFDHSYYNNADRPYSVPYAIGDMVKLLVERLDD